MAIGLRVVVALISLAFLFFVLMMVRRQKFLLRYSFLWIILGIAGFFAALCPDVIVAMSDALGFEVPSNFLFFATIFILMCVTLTLCGVVSHQSQRIVSLVQEVSLLKARCEGDLSEDGSCE